MESQGRTGLEPTLRSAAPIPTASVQDLLNWLEVWWLYRMDDEGHLGVSEINIDARGINWRVRIPLAGTSLEDKPFEYKLNPTRGCECRALHEGGLPYFEGEGSLQGVLESFVAWVQTPHLYTDSFPLKLSPSRKRYLAAIAAREISAGVPLESASATAMEDLAYNGDLVIQDPQHAHLFEMDSSKPEGRFLRRSTALQFHVAMLRLLQDTELVVSATTEILPRGALGKAAARQIASDCQRALTEQFGD